MVRWGALYSRSAKAGDPLRLPPPHSVSRDIRGSCAFPHFSYHSCSFSSNYPQGKFLKSSENFPKNESQRLERCTRTTSTTALRSFAAPASPQQSPSHRPYRPGDRARRALSPQPSAAPPTVALTVPPPHHPRRRRGNKELFGAARSISECAPYPCAVHTCPCGTGELREECATFITWAAI